MKLCDDAITKYWCVSLAIYYRNFQRKLGKNFLVNFLHSGLLTIQNCRNSHVTMTLAISNGLLHYWKFWKEKTKNVDAIQVLCNNSFYYKVWKMASFTVFGSFWEKMLQSVTTRESFTNFKTIITKCNKGCYKVWQVFQSETEFITNCDRHYIAWQLLQSET